jgi:hypothetical protein
VGRDGGTSVQHVVHLHSGRSLGRKLIGPRTAHVFERSQLEAPAKRRLH